MSRVILIAADKPLPLCDQQEERTKTVSFPDDWHAPEVRGQSFTVDYCSGFRVEEHAYYQPAVDALGYSMKPFQYELDFEVVEKDLRDLQTYLHETFTSGEVFELWSIWVGDEPHPELIRSSKTLNELDLAVLEQLNHADQLCFTITI